MTKLSIPYSTWKQVVQLNSLSTYHIIKSSDNVVVWCGTVQLQYRSYVDSEDYSDWLTNFPSSTLVVSDDDAIANIIGIDNAEPKSLVDISGVPKEYDGRLNVVVAPMTQGNYLWITGRGDHKENQSRGGGKRIGIRNMPGGYVDAITAVDTANKKFTIAGDKTGEFTSLVEHIYVEGSTGNDDEYCIKSVEEVSGNTVIEVFDDISDSTVDGSIRHARIAHVAVPFIECTEIQDGQTVWDPDKWGIDDEFSFAISFPATPYTSNPGTGNANIDGTYGWITPADGDGDITIDMTTAVPIPYTWVPGAPGGFYDYAVDKWDGDLTPVDTPFSGELILFPFAIDSARFMKSVSMYHPLGVFDIEVTKTEWLHKNWLLDLIVSRTSDNPASVALWLQFYRRHTT